MRSNDGDDFLRLLAVCGAVTCAKANLVGLRQRAWEAVGATDHHLTLFRRITVDQLENAGENPALVEADVVRRVAEREGEE